MMDSKSELLSFPGEASDSISEPAQAQGLSGLVNSIKMMTSGVAPEAATSSVTAIAAPVASSPQKDGEIHDLPRNTPEEVIRDKEDDAMQDLPADSKPTSTILQSQGAETRPLVKPKLATQSPRAPKPRASPTKILVDPQTKPSLDTTNASVYGVKSRRGLIRRVPSISGSMMSFPGDPNTSIGSFGAARGSNAVFDSESISSDFTLNFLSNLSAKRGTSGLGKEYWLEDSSAVSCGSCEKNFNTFRRRHHCRICGKIFCGNCTLFIPGEKFNYTGKMRVCHNCLKFADQYDDAAASSDESVADDTNNSMTVIRPIKSHDSTMRPRSMTPSLPDQLSTKEMFLNSSSQAGTGAPPKPPPMLAIPATRKGESVEIDVGGLHRGGSVHSSTNGRVTRSGTMYSTHRHGQNAFNDTANPNGGFNSGTRHRDDSGAGFKFFQPYTSTSTETNSSGTPTPVNDLRAEKSPFSTNEDAMSNANLSMIDDADDDSERSDGEQTMEAYSSLMMGSSSNLMQTGRSSSRIFSGSSLSDRQARTYRHKHRNTNNFHRMKNRRMSKSISRVQNNTMQFDMNNVFPLSSSSFNFGGAEEEDSPKKLFKASEEFRSVAEVHAKGILHQLLVDRNVERLERWQKVLIEILKPIILVNPDLRNGESFDIPEYIKLKRIPGASIEDSSVVEGVVFASVLALKSMQRRIVSPRIAVITFPIEFEEGSELRLTSLDPLINQESEYLKKLVGRIAALRPDLVLSASSVNGYALELLAKAGIAVAMNLKPQVIERVARMTEANIVTSINKLATDPKLGQCDMFEEKTFVFQKIKRTYLFLTGCAPESGCTILIRGGDMELLRQVKDCAILMLYVVFNIKLESALLRDEFLIVPEYLPTTSEVSIYETPINTFHDFQNALGTRLLSTSPWVKFRAPYVIYKLQALEKQIAENEECFADFQLQYSRLKELDLKHRQDLLDAPQNEVNTTKKRLIDLLGNWRITIDVSKLPNGLDDLPRIVQYTRDSKSVLLHSNYASVMRQWELLWNTRNAQFLDPVTHQALVVLYSMVSTKNATPCIGPFIQELDYYWDTDMCLGQYIEHVCLHANDICTEGCGLQLKEHYRSYVHASGKIDVVVESSPCRLVGWEHCILTWSYCKQCRTTTPVVPISDNSWKFSLAKYFELSFWSQDMHVNGPCPHSFYRDHIRYFGLENLAVRVEFSTIECLELVPPRFKIMWKPEMLAKLKLDSYEQVEAKAAKFFDSVLERLTRVKVDSMTVDKMEAGQKKIEELKEKLEAERAEISAVARNIYNTTEVDKHLQMNSVIRSVQELSVEWDQIFQAFIVDFLPTEKDITRITAFQLRKFFADNKDDMEEEKDEKPKMEDTDEKWTENKLELEGEQDQASILNRDPLSRAQRETIGSPSQPKKMGVLEKVSQIEAKSKHDSDHSLSQISSPSLPVSPSASPTKAFRPSGIRHFTSSTGTLPTLGIQPAFKMPIPLNTEFEHEMLRGRSASMVGSKTRDGISKLGLEAEPGLPGKVKKLTDQFEELNFQELSKAFEMQRELDRRKMDRHRNRAMPVGASKPLVKVFENVQDAVGEEIRPAGLHRPSEDSPEMNVPKTAEEAVKKDSVSGPIEQEKTSLMKTLAHFWADRSATLWKPLDYPLLPSEHIFVDSDVIVREDEPSSLIAFCLSSSDYVSKLSLMRTQQEARSAECDSEAATASESGEIKSVRSENSNESRCEAETTMLKKTGIHLKYQFQEGISTLSCKIFFAEQFDAFRRHCGCDENFIQSLSRCVKWDSTGGKSGSAFLKTLDDRFIIKELSSVELDAFVRFAPSYFEYFAQALFHDLPTVLAKIFGFYQIQIKNPADGRSFTMDVLIMENLFYDRKTSRIFDLKGSMRNRHVEQTGKENEVLLDENMVEYIYESPLFVREHAKKVLRASLWNDTLFLAKMNVMDYSLVIGIDADNNELVVGIIDCIRTFTWDKKLESWVKEKGLVGGGGAGKEPTVITPKQYKNRFREAMERYILMVPGPWYINTR
ncbi:unnamed protein product [Kuraishia capsulata CBS 1993]|uniref:1-phosphatidylinositol-3-phosphate 5-kinase n=1 Tax=Kuraishia capsulata CBS 1993 TaxID=1382522 RepID=W6MGF9_9ASCO|nr:uncharacterized protein KUCA_T00001146001 [Kuraishia capsulata CBS 1993]CDK25179.1 unnamed protein product [Kuraishia capsulata CBS 1993]